MSYTDSLHEKGADAHRQDSLLTAGHQRAPAPFSHHASGLIRQMALAVFVLVAGTRLKRLGRKSKPQHVAARPLSSLGSPHH